MFRWLLILALFAFAAPTLAFADSFEVNAYGAYTLMPLSAPEQPNDVVKVLSYSPEPSSYSVDPPHPLIDAVAQLQRTVFSSQNFKKLIGTRQYIGAAVAVFW